jgi:hypothetical protein
MVYSAPALEHTQFTTPHPARARFPCLAASAHPSPPFAWSHSTHAGSTRTTTTTTTTAAPGGEAAAAPTATPTAEEGVPPQEPEPVANPAVGGLFMRWDPNDPAATEAPAKWAAAVTTMKALPPMSEKGFEAQQSIMDFGEEIKAWTSDTMIPFTDDTVTTGQLTAMLRSRGTIADGVSVSAVDKKALGIQGILSQTYRYTVTYEGGEGPKSMIAKFAPPAVDWKFLTGSTCLKSLAEEVTVYETEFFTKIGLGKNVGAQAQPQCFFAAYDDIREELIILLEDFGERALTAGDQISGGPATGKPPSLEKFLPAFKAAGDLNGKYFVSYSWRRLLAAAPASLSVSLSLSLSFSLAASRCLSLSLAVSLSLADSRVHPFAHKRRTIHRESGKIKLRMVAAGRSWTSRARSGPGSGQRSKPS